MQIRFDRRFSNGLSITFAYTWGKALAYTTGTTSLASIDYYIDLHKNYGRPDFDRTHTLVESFIYELPFGKGKRWLTSGFGRAIAGGWRISGIVSMMPGEPLTFSASSSSLNAPENKQLADINGPFRVTKNGSELWFDTSVFNKPSGTNIGNTSVECSQAPDSSIWMPRSSEPLL